MGRTKHKNNHKNGSRGNSVGAKAYLAAIVESSDDAIISKNLNGVVTSWNAAAERIFGFTSIEAVGKPLINLIIPPDRKSEEDEILSNLRQGRKIDHFQTRRCAKSGQLIDVSITVSPIRNSKGEIIGASKVARDVTEQKKQQEALDTQRQWFEVTLASIGDAVVATDERTKITYLNAVAEKLTGWTHQEALGRPIAEVFRIINEDSRLPVQHPLDDVIRTGSIHGLANHTVLIARNGIEHSIEDAAAPIRLPDGKLIGAVLVFHDIGDRRILEKELKRKAETLAEKDRRKDEFLAMLAHELRNPLAPVSNAIQIARRKTLNEAIKEDALEMASQQVSHIVRLLDDLLDVSRITHGKIGMRQERVDLCLAIKQATDSAMPLITQRQQMLKTMIPDCPIWVRGDGTRLTQLFGNLFNNAAKYTPDGGSITFNLEEQGNEVIARLKDTGIGITPEKLPYIFDMFMQVDNSMERSYGGLGIGLTLVRRIAELHRGNVEAHSEGKDKGTEFIVRLPIIEKGKTLPVGKIPVHEWAACSFRTLVVDDNKASAKTLGWMLESVGHKVEISYTATAALATAAIFKPDIVLLDIGMPDMNGYELCRALRQEAALQDAVFIAQTGWGQEHHLQRARDAGFDFHLTKPISFEALQQQLENIQKKTVNSPQPMAEVVG